jgi:hypothetical protein
MSERLPQSENELTQLADRFGSDKGSSKHRYTELYHMLFQPYRQAKLNFLEMGLMIGGPEHGIDKDREVKEPPSVRMWLEYFPNAHIIGLDVSDFAAYQTDRFTFYRCDMDDRANIAEAAEKMRKAGQMPNIIIDDASHASRHQQDAFLTLFPLLAPGGMYIIEDLRWQPPVYEAQTPGFIKTGALFQTYVTGRQFAHTDPAYTEELNSLVPMISGCFMFQVRYNKTRRDQVAVIHKL